jgi:hypothetical protein
MRTGVLLLLIAGFARAATPLDAELDALVALYVGTYRSQPDEGARDARPIVLRVIEVAPPPGHRRALYSEMRNDGPDGELYRQSLLVFDEAPDRRSNRMTALGFADRALAARLPEDPTLVASGRLATTPALAPGCAMQFSRLGDAFLGRIDRDTCVITGKRGDTRHIESETLLRADAIEQLERGYDPAGKLLFGNPDGRRYVWPRLAAVAPAAD